MAKSGSSVTPASSLSTHHSHQSFQKSCAEVLQHRGMSPWMNAERPRILCPWLELARQHTTVPSLIYPASQQVLLVWAQCYVNIAVWLLNWSWFVCLASLEYGLTELMSEWIICLHMPVLSIVNAKAQFPLQKNDLSLELQGYEGVDNSYHNIVCKWNDMLQLLLQDFQHDRYDIWDLECLRELYFP